MKTTMKPTEDYVYIENCDWLNIHTAFVVRFPSWLYYMSHIICFGFNIIQTLLTIFLNYLAVHALCKSPQLRRKTTLFLVMLLSVSDLAFGVIVAPPFLSHIIREIYGTEGCFGSTLKKVTMDILPSLSLTIFVVLNVEIYLSIIHPIFHKTKVTNRRVLKILCVLVILSIARSYLYAFHINKQAGQLFISQCILIAIAGSTRFYSHQDLASCLQSTENWLRKRRSFL